MLRTQDAIQASWTPGFHGAGDRPSNSAVERLLGSSLLSLARFVGSLAVSLPKLAHGQCWIGEAERSDILCCRADQPIVA